MRRNEKERERQRYIYSWKVMIEGSTKEKKEGNGISINKEEKIGFQKLNNKKKTFFGAL